MEKQEGIIIRNPFSIAKGHLKRSMFILLLCIAGNIYAQQNFALKMNIGNVGASLHVPLNVALEIDLINLGFEHRPTGLGMEFSLIKFWNYLEGDYFNNMENSYSLLNLGVYWNMLNMNRTQFSLSLFGEVNYMHGVYKIGFRWDDFVFTGGLRFGFSGRLYGGMNYNVFNVEVGYRNIDRKHTYYVSANVDMLVFVFFILYAKSN